MSNQGKIISLFKTRDDNNVLLALGLSKNSIGAKEAARLWSYYPNWIQPDRYNSTRMYKIICTNGELILQVDDLREDELGLDICLYNTIGKKSGHGVEMHCDSINDALEQVIELYYSIEFTD